MLEVVEGGLCLLETTRRVLLCMLEVVEGGLCLLEVMRCVLGGLSLLEATRCVLRCMREVAEGGLCLLEATRCVLLCMLEIVEGGLCLLEVMRCVLGALYAGGWPLFRGVEISVVAAELSTVPSGVNCANVSGGYPNYTGCRQWPERRLLIAA